MIRAFLSLAGISLRVYYMELVWYNKRIVGEYDSKRNILFKSGVVRSVHQMRKFGKAWGISLEALSCTKEKARVILILKKEKLFIITNRETIYSKGFKAKFEDPQIFLAEKYWKEISFIDSLNDRKKEIVKIWNEGNKEGARRLWRDYFIAFSEDENNFFRRKLKIISEEKISDEVREAQKIFGGKILNQYGEEYQEDKTEDNIGKRNSKKGYGIFGGQRSLFLEK